MSLIVFTIHLHPPLLPYSACPIAGSVYATERLTWHYEEARHWLAPEAARQGKSCPKAILDNTLGLSFVSLTTCYSYSHRLSVTEVYALQQEYVSSIVTLGGYVVASP